MSPRAIWGFHVCAAGRGPCINIRSSVQTRSFRSQLISLRPYLLEPLRQRLSFLVTKLLTLLYRFPCFVQLFLCITLYQHVARIFGNVHLLQLRSASLPCVHGRTRACTKHASLIFVSRQAWGRSSSFLSLVSRSKANNRTRCFARPSSKGRRNDYSSTVCRDPKCCSHI